MVPSEEVVEVLPGTCEAERRLIGWQVIVLVLLAAGALAAAVMWPDTSAAGLVAFWIVGSAWVNIHRLWLACESAAVRRSKAGLVAGVPAIPERALPSYTLLVPLHREAPVVPHLVAGLRALDYPRDRLQVLFLIRAEDADTREALVGQDLPAGWQIVLQPPDLPIGTKPAACNYGLSLATGELLVIYDAEDLPDRDQLRKAAAALLQGPPDVACVETPRATYNAHRSLMTRLYEVESLAWHRHCLLALDEREGLAPLHGSGAHFRTAVLRELGGWDYYNVTEDCDLGTRLYRRGYRIALLDSTTGEEAPPTLKDWLRQRTRWNKGFIQTFFVHTRQPIALIRSLGLRGTFTFATLLGVAHANLLIGLPAWLASLWWLGVWAITGHSALSPQTARFTVFMLNYSLVIVLLAVGLNVAAVVGARRWRALPYTLLTPVHWVLLTVSAYRAAWQFVTGPFTWEKTPHGRK